MTFTSNANRIAPIALIVYIFIYSNDILFSTCVQSSVLLDVAELFESALAVGTLVRLLAGVDANVLDQLVVGAERLETLLALVWFAHFQAAAT